MSRKGFTLVELLVVVGIIGMLVGLLLPAVQSARSAARRISCSNNMRQIGLALHNYHDTYGRFPPSGQYGAGETGDSWSVQARLLPFMEQAGLHDLIDWDVTYKDQPHVAGTRVPVYICPSEANDRQRSDNGVLYYPLNYGVNVGTWLVYDPNTRAVGNGLTAVNGAVTMASLLDGASNTLAFAEVKAFQAYVRDSGQPAAKQTPLPHSPSAIAVFGGNFKRNSGHTEWTDCRAHQSGVTGTFAPNTQIPFERDGRVFDVDFNSSREGKTIDRPTFAVVTSRSYHPGGVNALLADGSMRFVAETIDVSTWRGLASRHDGAALESF